jgi:hypothetical protein
MPMPWWLYLLLVVLAIALLVVPWLVRRFRG